MVAPRHGQRDSRARRLLALADVVGIALALTFSLMVAADRSGQLLWGLLTLPGWIVLFKAYGLYERDIKRINHTSVDDLPWTFHAVLLGCILLFGYYKLAPPSNIDMAHLAVFGITAILTVSGMRAIARRLALGTLGRERVALIGAGRDLAALADKMQAHPEYGVEPVALVSSPGSAASRSGIPLRAELASYDLAEAVEAHGVDRVVVAHDDLGDQELLDLLRGCRELGVKLSVVPQLFDALGPSVEVDDVEGLTVLGVNPPVLSPSSRFLKRTMDVVGSAALLALTAPLFLLIAIAIKLDSRGPVFFRQGRIGREGRGFRLIKFRTMVADAERRQRDLLEHSKDPDWLLLDHDPRITRVGRVLRFLSLDELPQLWNVLKGEMSLVGPRPLIESEHRRLDGWGESRIDLTPGLTGLWQVLGRTRIPFQEMIKLDYLYVTNWSLWNDMRLILRTVPAVLLRRGAN